MAPPLLPRAPKAVKKSRDTREPLNMRIKPTDRRLIDHAAALTGKNRTDFVLDACPTSRAKHFTGPLGHPG